MQFDSEDPFELLIDGQGGENFANAGDGVDACFNASDLTGTCEPKWLAPRPGVDESIASAGTSHLTHAGCSVGFYGFDLEIGGATYYRSLSYGFEGTCMAAGGTLYGCIEPGDYTSEGFVLGGDYRRLVATVGQDDWSNVDGTLRIEVLGDDVVLFSRLFSYGEHHDLKLDVSGVQQLTLKMTVVDLLDCEGAVYAVFGSPIVSANVGVRPLPPLG